MVPALILIVKNSTIDPKALELLDTNLVKPLILGIITQNQQMAQHLLVEEVVDLREVFDMMDVDQRGKINLEELRVGLQRLGQQVPNADLQILMEATDVGGNGTLNYGEFVAVSVHLKKMGNDEHSHKAFAFFDQNLSGYIEIEELREKFYNNGKIASLVIEKGYNGTSRGLGFVNINIASVVLFVVIASCFLVSLYKCMFFFELLVVLFGIGSIGALKLDWLLYYRAFAVVWATYQDVSFVWIGQYILGIALIPIIPQLVHVPNLKVRINLPNGDMVGHTGDIDATVVACKATNERWFLILLNLAEIADGPSLFHSQKDFPFSTVSCIRSDGNRRRGPPRRSSASRRINEDENETPQSSSNGKKSNASDQEEIIALFRRIQSSISKGESVSTKKTNSNESKDKPSPDLILEALRKSRKQIKDKPSNKEGKKVLTGKRGVPQKEEVVENSPPVAGLKPTRPPSKFVKRSPIPSRPPSKFVKRSPIPSPSTPRGRMLELNNEASQARAGGNELKFQRIEEMKLTELKELAKSRGIKGYSKLKKSELLELLRSENNVKSP
ncbi:hypothetical protein I3843_09G071400 [Carya illinoinensis]|nr:hypothetical protein I3843_09G071400 [Carya illinoinensis]